MVKLRKKQLSNGYFHLYLDINSNGNRKKEYLKLYLRGTKEDKEVLKKADEIRAKTEYELMCGTYITSRSMRISFYEFYEKYSGSFARKAEKDNLVYYHMKKVRPELTFEEINPEFWAELKEHFIRLGHANYTIFVSFRTLNSIINAAVNMELIPKNNLSKVSEKRPATHREYLLIEDLRKLEQTPCKKEFVKNAFLFACYTGLRKGDLQKLTYGNIKNNQIEIKQQKTQEYVYIPISQHAFKYIPNYDKPHENKEKIFGHFPDGTVHATLKLWVQAAGINKNVMFHTSRHTFATLALSSGVELETVGELLGHKDLRATKIYAKIISKKKEEAINKLPQI
jgi:integrase